MRNFFKILFLAVSAVSLLYMSGGCHKEIFATKGALSFSTDTLSFDTVFTTLGSTTQYFKVRNPQSQAINISDIRLLQLQGNQFRINVDGVSGTEFKNVSIPAHDSIYVFVEVTINPNSALNPFVITDQVQFLTNGATQKVVLEAMGQNAYYHFSDSISGSVTWPADKPHIIINKHGHLPILEILPGATLTIQPHTQIYMAPNAVITLDGTLNAHGGSWADSIAFRYIRLESDYQGKSGQWLGITYSRSATINMDHVIIDQSNFGLSDEYVLDNLFNAQITTSNLKNYAANPIPPTVTLDKCIIRNCSNAMVAIATTLNATNCLFHSSGGSMVQIGMGGTYNISNCTVANMFSSGRQDASFVITDRITYLPNNDSLKTQVGPYVTTASIVNTAIVGTLTSELYVSPSPSSVTASFRYCNITIPADSFHLIQSQDNNCLYNSYPPQFSFFKDPASSNYMPDSTTSPLYGKGYNYGIVNDFYGYPRSSPPSVGAIEWHN